MAGKITPCVAGPSGAIDMVEEPSRPARRTEFHERVDPRNDVTAASALAVPRVRPVFKPRDSAVFWLLTLLNSFAIAISLAIWLSAAGWNQAPLLCAGLTVLLVGCTTIQQARWWLLPMMRQPPPVTPHRLQTVAVVTTFVPGSEPLEMLAATVQALVGLNYPHDTWVLDEGDDDRVKEVCRRYGARHFSRRQHRKYQAPRGAFRAGTKYGNYNAWLAEVGFANYEIIAAFDPDHVPEPEFLTAVVGHFEDPQVAYVQVAQAYGNQRESWIARGAAEETYDYYSTIQMASFGMRLPMIVGGHNTHRTAALQQIGGFAAHDADDILTTLHYRETDWQGVYVPEILARGRTPSDWHAYLAQQRRWARSVLDIKLRTYPSLSAHAGAATRLLSMFHGLNYVAQGLLPLLVFGLLCLVCSTMNRVQESAAWFVVSLVVLAGSHALCERFRQRFYLDPRSESGLHWRAFLLRCVKWPQTLLALLEVVLNRHPAYTITAKVRGPVSRWEVFGPHALATAILAGCWLVGIGTGQATLVSHGIMASAITALIALWTATCSAAPEHRVRQPAARGTAIAAAETVS